MGEGNEVPMYGIGTVSRRTGLNPATIRSWELRYGGVVPHRTASGHRLYTPRQARQLEWLADRVRDGLHAGEAHRLLPSWDDEERPPAGLLTPSGDEYDRFGRWARRAALDLETMLVEVADIEAVRAVMVGANTSHTVFGLSNTVVAAVTVESRRDIGPFSDLVWSFLPGPAAELLSGGTVEFRVAELAAPGASLFEGVQVDGAVLAPVVIDQMWVGTVGVAFAGRRPDRRSAAVVEAARDAVAARYALHAALVPDQ